MCSGQVKMDTQLSHPCQRLIFIGTDIAQRGVFPSTVVAHLDRLDHIRSRLLARRLVALSGAFAFYTATEPFGYGIVSALALATHTTPEPVSRQQALGVITGLVTPALRMGQEPRPGTAAAPGHPERCLHQGGGKAVTHRPAPPFRAYKSSRTAPYPPPRRSIPPSSLRPRPERVCPRHTAGPGDAAPPHRPADCR